MNDRPNRAPETEAAAPAEDLPEIEEGIFAEEPGEQAGSTAREKQLETELADLRDKALRTLAEMDNLRKRTQREKQDLQKYAVADLAKALLPVVDNLRRALDALPEEARTDLPDGVGQMITGVEMTERELLTALDKFQIKKIDPLGEAFDYNFHQAMFEVEHSGQAPGTVVQVMQPGYVIHDRLLRPAMVGVAKGDQPTGERVDTEV